MRQAASHVQSTASQLRSALENGDLRLHLQPRRHLDGSPVACAEVSLHWFQGTEEIPAPRLLQIAEQSGQIDTLSHFLIQASCKTLRELRKKQGGSLMTAAGGAVLDILTAPGFLDSVVALGDYLGAELQRLAERHGLPGERGTGLLRALVLADDRGPRLVAAARARQPEGLLLNAPRPHLLRFMPALNVSREEIDLMLGWLDELLADPTLA